jgi:hypothetical protein
MLTCPMCKKSLSEWVSHCPRCRADLSILVDYVSHLHDGLERADRLTRDGELGEAVWAYLEVLEVDPDNAIARKHVDRVAAAVRNFDRAAIGRRWIERLRRQAVFRRWLSQWQDEAAGVNWWSVLLVVALLLVALGIGYKLGSRPDASASKQGAPDIVAIDP